MVRLSSIPVLGLGGAVSLSPVLEPVADLCCRQSGDLGQGSLLARRRVSIAGVAILEDCSRLLLEAVRRLLAVPDGRRQRKLAPDAVLADGAQRTAAGLLGLGVVRLEPERLEAGVVERREGVRLEDAVEFLEVCAVERHDCLRLEDALVLVKMITGRQRPEEPSQPVDTSRVLQYLQHAV